MLFIKRYLLPRIIQFLVVVFVGITIVFFVPRLTPVDPVQQVISQITSQGAFMDPASVDALRKSLTEMYGLEGGMFQQYFAFWGRLLRGDFGPSLFQFPVPVIDLIMNSLPWTVGLLITTTVIAWIIGNILGALAGYFKNKVWAKTLDNIAMVVRPMPYYIFALLLLILFAYLIPIFPSAGGYSVGRQIGFNWPFISDLIIHSFLPAMSLVILGIAANFMTMKLIVSNIVAEDYVMYAKAGGLKESKIAFKYVFRNGLLPQITGLALSLGQIFGGALITEIVFSYPGIGTLLYGAINSGDYNLIMGIVSLSVIGIAGATLIIDLIYPLFDPRIRYR
ncbi:ABC transporter permease [Petrotoga sp. 9PWA.NaAc.5.4]|uniref:ABC transporter permease n=1 Tax=Petrotoga sp. 9PWA.NaAc.5.4 TaxID=1434328 RepID=UPI000CB598C6|nr:ABC transporter permease [Petrotoga sp. 9PWA.NaAc.5.4]PNR93396.1 ABC transporter permease [Petrotoga sp. 9PWA.NaAc.5.4]